MAPNVVGNTVILAEPMLQTNNINNTKRTTEKCQFMERGPNLNNNNTNNNNITNNNIMKSFNDTKTSTSTVSNEITKTPYHIQIVWVNVIKFVILHLSALYGFYLVYLENGYIEYIFSYGVGIFGGFGITAGAHRLWSHKSYKAKWPMRVFLMVCQTLALQNTIYEWVRDHRVHHKFTDTNADPHNSKRGFFFSHMGWLLCKKHPDVKEKGKTVDMSDLEADGVVMFQKKYYYFLIPICYFILPSIIPYYVIGSSFKVCLFSCTIARYVISLHYTWLVNSAAHFYGMKPYDKSITATNNKLVSFLTNGEGWHNYHHVFPWDYKAAELGSYSNNLSTALIDFCAMIGLASDLKSVSQSMIKKRIERTGDGSGQPIVEEENNNVITEALVQHLNHDNEVQLVWGWDDQDMKDDDKRDAFIDKKAN